MSTSALRVLLAAAAVLLLAVACGDGRSDGGAEQETLVIALPSEPESLSPIYMDFDAGNWKVFNGLVDYDANLNLVPDLAAELPQVSPDGRTVTVRLRPDVRFHDGTPLTADDVVFTWQALLDPQAASPLRGRFDLANVLREVRALDPQTVEFSLARTDPAFIHKLYVGIVPRHLLAGKDVKSDRFNREPVGTGPYVFRAWRPGERIVLERNPDYFREGPRIPRLVYTFVEDENARAALLRSGEVDAAGLPPRLAAGFRDDSRFQVVEVPSADARVAVLPSEDPDLQDPRVRRALSLAVNRQAMVDGILSGAGEPAYGPFIRGAAPPAIPYDPDQARDLLRQAGWTPGADGFLQRDGRRLAFTLLYPASDSVRKELALAVRSDLAAVGVDATVEGVGWDVIYQRLGEAGNVFGWGQPYDPELELWDLFHSSLNEDDDPLTNPGHLRSREIDGALEAARRSLDPQQRQAAYRRLQEALQADGTWLYLVQLRHVVVLPAGLTNVQVQTEGHAHGFSRGVAWNIEQWELRR